MWPEGTARVVAISSIIGFVGAGLVAFTMIGPSGFALEFLLISPLRTDLVGGSLTLAIAVAFLSGASMILLPCGYPLLLTLTPTSLRMSSRSWLVSLGSFTLGIGGAMALVGVIVSLVGKLLLETLLLASPASRVFLATIVYGSLGVVSILLAFKSLRLLKYSPPIPGFQTLSQLFSGKAVQVKDSRKRMLAFGALYGGGMGVGCPVPVYWALLFWAAVIGSPAFGAMLLGLHGLGYVAPLLALGILVRTGFSIMKWIPQKGQSLESMMAGGLLTFGIFLVIVFAVAMPMRMFLAGV